MSISVSICVRAQVKKTDDSIGPEVESAVKDLQNGEVSAIGRVGSGRVGSERSPLVKGPAERRGERCRKGEAAGLSRTAAPKETTRICA